MKKTFIIIFSVVIISLIGLLIYGLFFPNLSVNMMKMAFENINYSKGSNFNEKIANVEIKRNIKYDSQYKNNIFDLIYPKDNAGNLPVIIWVHGGAYVGGDKKNTETYSVYLANEGFAVFNINYELAPTASYPTPLKQINDIYQHIKDKATDYGVDINKIILGGDSAGAQIVAQYVNTQVNKEYATLIGIKQIVPVNSIKGTILFCGPYDVSKFDKTDNGLTNFFFSKSGEVYFKDKKWQSSTKVKEATVKDYIKSYYPPTFITDGNVGSYEDHAKALEEVLRESGIYVDSVFYKKSEAILEHQYQFDMGLSQAQETFEILKKFLNIVESKNDSILSN